MQLAALDTAQEIDDINLPGFKLHPLKGDRDGIWSITINGNWRITFEFIYDVYLEPSGFSCRYLAKQLDVASSTLNRVLKGQSAISPEMALRLSKAIGRTPESWLAMQDNYDLWHAKQQINLTNVHVVNFAVA